MTLLLHILAKDLRYLRRPLAIWLALLVCGGVGGAEQALSIPTVDAAPRLFALANLVVGAAGTIMSAVVIAMLARADPLVGTDGFWWTRPIPRTTLFLSKLTFIVLFVVLPAMVTQTLSAAAAGMVPGDLLIALPEQLLIGLLGAVVTLWMAGLASSVARMFVWVFLPCLVLPALLATTLFAVNTSRTPRLDPVATVHDPTPLLAMELVMTIGFLAIVWWHYRSRDRAGSVLFGVVVFFAAATTPAWWPRSVSFVGGAPRLTEAWAVDPNISKLRLDTDTTTFVRNIDRMRDDQTVSIDAPVVLEGVPGNYIASPYTTSAYVRYEGGKYVTGRRSFPQTVQVAPEKRHPSLRWQDAGLGVSLMRPDALYETWPVLLETRAGDLKPHAGASGDYVGTFSYSFVRVDRLGTLPIRAGATLHDRSNSVELLRILSQTSGCRLLLRTRRATLAAYGAAPPVLSYHIVDRAGHPAEEQRIRIGVVPDPALGRYAPYARLGLPLTIDVIETSIPAASCDGLQIVVDRSQAAGDVSRELLLPHFQVR